MFKSLNAKRIVPVVAAVAACAAVLLTPDIAHAGSGGQELESIWTLIKEWSEGTLGKIVSGAMAAVGLVGSIVRQNLWPIAIGLGSSIGFANFPSVIETINSATVKVVNSPVGQIDWSLILQTGL